MIKDVKNILLWLSIIGAIFMIVVGSLLHFTYEWSGQSPIVGLFSPVNESVWEHLKLGLFSLLIFSLIEYPIVKNYVNNYWLGKAVGILCLELMIIIIFYTYTAFTNHPILFIDISTYIIGCIVCAIVSYKLMNLEKSFPLLEKLSIVFILILVILFAIFTFTPPKCELFKS
ncbi:DUF6512 family protein [Haloimpatiens lingqiaonensis]|uniref:DUF6512 family protein n=1 Tax=Haloimpatiens lingqiaonensis TaxID=1380675 RepID=UPI0010FF0368|nr:DUF6512 family protein [Haloimpatiens lingqiaonensis]